MFKKLWRKYGINSFDSLLKRAERNGDTRFLVCWNRGLGDIPLGLYALSYRIRELVPNAQITFVTRSDLLDGFKLLEGVNAVADPEWKRGIAFDLDKTFLNTGLCRTDFDVILERPDPTNWLMWQLGKLVPRLNWCAEWDSLCQRFSLNPNKKYVGVHVQTETNYAYEKNWPLEYWKECLKKIHLEYGAHVILFGFAPNPFLEGEGIVDLRGKTSLFEMLSIIKNHCNYLLVPDSGVLSIAYYINASFPIEIVSLWADPRQGVLKQNVASPNPQLCHRALIAENKDLRTVSVESALKTLFGGKHNESDSKIRDIIHQIEQLHLLAGIDALCVDELQSFLKQLQKYDSCLFFEQKALISGKDKTDHSNSLPCSKFERSGNPEDRLRGEVLLREGKVGCLILAGGQGTRLGFNGPKGAVPVTPIKRKSLFQIFCERTKVAGQIAGKKLPLCIMTSQLNHAQTLDFFKSHDFFGLEPSQVSFFEQEMLPFLDDSGNWLLEKPGKIAEGPDGNGHALRLFYENGIWKKWKESGVEYLNAIFVDNPLADPFDPEFVGLTERTGVDAALKAVERLSPDEKMGVLGENQGKLKVIEYFEIPSDSSGFTLSSTGMFCISMQFIQHLCEESQALMPLHLSSKSAHVLPIDQSIPQPVNVWKCERFIFDLLNHVRSSTVLVCPREKVYAPLKNACGDKSLETVQKALLSHDQEIYH